MRPVVVVGLAAVAVAAAALLGARVERWRGRRALGAYTGQLETELAAAERECDHLATEAAQFPQRIQKAYNAGLAAASEVDGFQVICVTADGGEWPWPPHGVRVPPEKWRTLREEHDNAEAN